MPADIAGGVGLVTSIAKWRGFLTGKWRTRLNEQGGPPFLDLRIDLLAQLRRGAER